MSMKPILFNTEMVRAILDGRKSCTRRIVKPQQLVGLLPDKCKSGVPEEFLKEKKFMFKPYCDMTDIELINTAYKAPYQPGDILYVRETWQYLYELDGNEQVIEDTGKYYYAATDTIPFNTYVDENGVRHDHAPWRPSIHMPKEAARIWLKVTDVRVERLQEITTNQIEQEGVETEYPHVLNGEEKKYAFQNLWNSTIKKSDLDFYGWDANPYVWVIEFERCEKPGSEV
jgi:hypothetical protein